MRLVVKLTIALGLGVLLVLGVHAYTRVQREARFIQRDMAHDARIIGRSLRLAVDEVFHSRGEAAALKLVREVDRLLRRFWIRFAWLDTSQHLPTPLGAKQRDALGAGQEVVTSHRDGQRDRLVVYVPMRLGARRGAVAIGRSFGAQRRYLEETLRHEGLITAAVAGVCVLVALVLGAWLVGRPVRRLVDQARRIGAGDLQAKLHLGRRDELAQLAQEMNAMCDRLREAKEQVEAETAARLTALEQLRHADRLTTLGTLAAGMAHELGTPLQVIAARAQMIARGEIQGEAALTAARVVTEQAGRMAEIIRQLLSFARRRKAQTAPTDLCQVVRQTLDLVRPLLRQQSLRTEVTGLDLPQVAALDPDQMQQAITNLLMNAMQASPPGGRITVSIERRPVRPPADHGGSEADHLVLTVADEGAGIAPENVDRVFEPFFTTKEPGMGTGLGLSVAYGIVQEHGGWIEVDSQVGTGSRFRVCLPVAARVS